MKFVIEDKYLPKCRFSSDFGFRIHPITGKKSGHRGIDIAMPSGTPIVAPTNGKVYMNKTNGGGVNKGYGHYLVVELDNGYYFLFGHLKQLSHLRAGAKFKKGEIIAYSGNTGASTGAHLHLETHKGGFLFSSQVQKVDYVESPLISYPQLKGMQGQYLGSLQGKFDEKPKEPIVEERKVEIVKININGAVKEIRGFNEKGEYFGSVREILETLGFSVDWDKAKREILADAPKLAILNENNGQTIQVDRLHFNNKNYTELRSTIEGLNGNVGFVDKKVSVKMGQGDV